MGGCASKSTVAADSALASENAALKLQIAELKKSIGKASAATPKPNTGQCIMASGKNDIAQNDHGYGDAVKKVGGKPMTNVTYVKNEKGAKADGYPGDISVLEPTAPGYEPPVELGDYHCHWKLDDRPRKMALLLLDMQEHYRPWVANVIPNNKKVLEAFRAKDLPVVWTNWGKVLEDGWYSGADRFFGPEGMENHETPQFIITHDKPVKFGPEWKKECSTCHEIAPVTPMEKGREIMSMHYSKFADLDENGNEILMPLLKSWDIDTVVVIGSWSEVCILSTVVEACDRYGLDVVVIDDTLATGCAAHWPSIFVMKQVYALMSSTAEFCNWMKKTEKLTKVDHST